MIEQLQQYFYTPTKEELVSPVYVTWVGKRRCLGTHTVGPRKLNGYKIAFVVRGSGYLEQGTSTRISLSRGDMFVLFPEIQHFYYANPEDPWELSWTFFNGNMCEEALDSIGVSLDHFVVRSIMNHAISRTQGNLLQSMKEDSDIGNLQATGNMYILFAQLKAGIKKELGYLEDKQDNVVEKAICFVEENYAEPLDVETLCTHVNYSRSYLSRAFRKEVGETIPEFVTNIRMGKAKRMLEETNLSVKEISYAVGINDCFYFSKLFKKSTGFAPTVYKKHFLAENLRQFDV